MGLNTAKLSSAAADGVRRENGYKLCLEKMQTGIRQNYSHTKTVQYWKTPAHRVCGILTTEAPKGVHYTKLKLMLAVVL